MKAKCYYRNTKMPSIVIYVNYIMRKETDGVRLNVDWYTRDDFTHKLIALENSQEYFCSKDLEKEWLLIEDNSDKVSKMWRGN
jgi:hypothetical protein